MNRELRFSLMVFTAVVLTAFNLRTTVTGFNPLLTTIGADLDFDRGLYGAFGTIVTGCFAICGFAASALARRIGLERSIVLAVALTTLGIVLRSTSQTGPWLVASTVVAAAGVGASNVLVVPIVKRYFASRIEAVSSIYIALLSIGQFAAPLVALPIAHSHGWRWAVGVWAILTAAALILWIRIGTTSRTPLQGSRPTGALSGNMWRTPLLWSLVAMMGMTSLNVHFVITWLAVIVTDAGASPETGAAMLALFSILVLPAAFAVPPLALRLRNPFPIVVVCVLLLSGGYIGLLIEPAGGVALWTALLGIGQSTFPLCLALINARTRTVAGSSALSGAVQGIGYAIASLGPFGVGALYGVTGSWGAPLGALLATVAVLLVSGWIACRPGTLEDQISASAKRQALSG